MAPNLKPSTKKSFSLIFFSHFIEVIEISYYNPPSRQNTSLSLQYASIIHLMPIASKDQLADIHTKTLQYHYSILSFLC
ncbi:hypothetical protein CR513_24602, partial [Mucuna pruriens]